MYTLNSYCWERVIFILMQQFQCWNNKIVKNDTTITESNKLILPATSCRLSTSWIISYSGYIFQDLTLCAEN